jgi:hypothetical protein
MVTVYDINSDSFIFLEFQSGTRILQLGETPYISSF